MQEFYVDTPALLAELCAQFRRGSWVALDTEFLRERSYYPRLCLIQLADDRIAACIDPLAVEDLSPLGELLADPKVLKVLHAARQDMEIFYHTFDRVPAPVFDTQLAATLLGYGDQVGYGALVKEILGIDLDKSHARTDWEQRPLEAQQLRYAADDVIHLAQIYHKLLAELTGRGRLDWLTEDFADLTRPELYRSEPLEAWLRIKGRNRLRGVQLAALQRLAAWRERQAQKDDLPRRWVAPDEILLDVARMLPEAPERLGKIRGIQKSLVERHGRTLLALVAEAKALPREAWPQQELPERITEEQEAIADALMALVRLRGAEQHVSAAAIASRRDLEALLLGEGEIPLLHGWRAGLVGHELKQLVNGKLALRVRDGRLQLVECG